LHFCHFEVRTAKPKSERYPKKLSTLGGRIRTRRLDLGLIQSQIAAQIGVHELTITNWEGNASQPPARYLPAIIRFLGNDPSEPVTPSQNGCTLTKSPTAQPVCGPSPLAKN
jgi:transcriptional regulator with XRE-family HTH domain